MQENKVVFSVLTVNHPGVLLRVTGLFSRRGFNIDSIVACKTRRRSSPAGPWWSPATRPPLSS